MAYDCKHSPKGKPLLLGYIRQANTVEIPLTQTSLICVYFSHSGEENRISHLATYVWLPVVGLRLCFCPWSFSVLCFPMLLCTVSLALTLDVWVFESVSGCINYWLRVYSCFPQGLQPTNVEIPLSTLFLFQHFFVSKTFTKPTSKERFSSIINMLHLEHKLPFIYVQCSCK